MADIKINPKKIIIGILLDGSSSMRGRKIDSAKLAIETILKNISGDVSVVLTIFSTDLPDNHLDIIPYGLTLNSKIKQEVLQKLRKIQAGGRTPLYKAINKFMDDTWFKGVFICIIIISDGEDNQSIDIEYGGKKGKEAFFAKLLDYNSQNLIEIIPFAYGEINERDIKLIQELKNISGKALINEIDPTIITERLTNTVNSLIEDRLFDMEISSQEILSKLIKIKKDEKELLANPERLKDRLFLKTLMKNIDDVYKN